MRAARSAIPSTSNFRVQFRRLAGTSPQEYRKTFRGGAWPPARRSGRQADGQGDDAQQRDEALLERRAPGGRLIGSMSGDRHLGLPIS
ncbi:hypothetical protein [Promicromonospora sp. NPDC023987]|uniref:hypothetical protein n=1 Tax=Promicromonospora sp. NPDC023987 TaxID=3155360 RepID=UPI0033F34100